MKYLLTSLCTILILVAVLLPGSKVPDVEIAGIDKLAHFTLFAIWVIAVRRDFDDRFKWSWAVVAGLTFSIFTEIIQIVVDGRTFDWVDILADATGLLFGIALGGTLLNWLYRIFPWLNNDTRSLHRGK